VASWGFLGDIGTGESETQILAEPITVTLEADEITVEIDDG
jgi:hypothetical protein